uniref:MADF domain-containing protein n=1 Tax=Heliothis virescens TaxID=7102 RepID=A0A2A4JNV3_HELVI
MGVHLTEYGMARLVGIYRDYECLWNINHHLYRDNEARQAAYKEILQRLDIKDLTIKDIPNKIKNLRSSYYQELKKIKRNERISGTPYQPTLVWFAALDEFLRPFRTERSLFKQVSRKNENSNKNEDEPLMETGAERIPSAASRIEDEFDHFGKYIASSLRSMPPEFSIIAKTELQKTISDIQLQIVRKNNQHFNQSPYQCASSDNDNIGCETPTSDSCLSSVKIEFDE